MTTALTEKTKLIVELKHLTTTGRLTPFQAMIIVAILEHVNNHPTAEMIELIGTQGLQSLKNLFDEYLI